MLDTVVAALVSKSSSLLLERLVGWQAEQVRLLKGLQADVTALIEGPYNSGCEQLRAALAPHRRDRDREEYLMSAQKAFFDAYGQQRDTYYKSLSSCHLAIIRYLREDVIDARTYSLRAYAEAIDAVRERCLSLTGQPAVRLVRAQRDPVPLHGAIVKIGLNAALQAGPAGILIAPAVLLLAAGVKGGDFILARRWKKELRSLSARIEHVTQTAALCEGVGVERSEVPQYRLLVSHEQLSVEFALAPSEDFDSARTAESDEVGVERQAQRALESGHEPPSST